jgi:hypothetical protein
VATKATKEAIPREMALTLCQEIREAQRGRWWHWTAWWCWGCEKASGNDPAKMCWHSPPEFRGCAQVNALYSLRSARRRAP